MKTKLLLVLVALAVSSIVRADISHNFESYADDSAWVAAGRGGWVETLDGRDLEYPGDPENQANFDDELDEFQLDGNPCMDRVNSSVRCIHITSPENTAGATLTINFAAMSSGTFSFHVYSPSKSIPPYNYAGWIMGGVNPSLFHGMFYEYLNQATVQYGSQEPSGGYASKNMGKLASGWHIVEGNWNSSGRLNVWYDGIPYLTNAPMRAALGSGVTYLQFTSAPAGTNGSDVYIDNIVVRSGVYAPSNANHTFEEWTDTTAWRNAGRGGWTLTGQDEFVLANNPLVNGANPSAKVMQINSASNTPSGTLRLNVKPLTSGTFSFQVYTTAGSGSPYKYAGWSMGGVNPSLFHGMLYEYLNQATIQYGNVEPYGGYTSMSMGAMNGTWHTIEGYWWKDASNSGRLCVSQDGLTYINNAPMRNDISTGVSYFELSSAPTGTYAFSVYIDNIVVSEGAFESPLIYSNGAAAGQKIEMCLDTSGKHLSYIKFDNLGPTIHGGDGGLWRLHFIDANCEQLNTRPSDTIENNCGAEWNMGSSYITSRDATLTNRTWDPTTKTLTLTYTHTKADVTWKAVFGTDTVEFDAYVTNKTGDELQMVKIPDRWRIRHDTADNFIMPDQHNGVEYDFVFNFPYSQHSSAWDGFIVTTPTQYLGFFQVQPYDGWILATDTALGTTGFDSYWRYRAQGCRDNRISSLSSGTVCYRYNGESVDASNFRIGRYSTFRGYFDAYLAANFTGQSTLYNKIRYSTYGSQSLYDRLSGAVLLGTEGHYNNVANTIPNLPGKMIVHPTNYKHKTCNTNLHEWDAFPNYFPANPAFETVTGQAQAEHDAMCNAVNTYGHVLMPRTSFFYWTQCSDADVSQYGYCSGMAMKRIDGDAQQALWGAPGVGHPGWIMSPSSTNALGLMRTFTGNYFDTWRTKGASAYFTNVIGALSTGYNRYDFHPNNGGRPDHFWDRIYNNFMKWHGDRMPLFSETGNSRQMPYQAGFCYSPAWLEPNGLLDPCYNNWMAAWRGGFIRFRPEMQDYAGHEYTAYYAPNTFYAMSTYHQVAFAVLYGMQFKYAMDFDYTQPTGAWRWLRTLATLGQKVSRYTYGKRLDSFNRDITAGVHNANYEGNIAWGNFSGSGFVYGSETVAPDGFMFTSSDGLVNAGYFSVYNGLTFSTPTLMVVDKSVANRINVYTPNASTNVVLRIPLDGRSVSRVTVHYPNGTTSNVSYTVSSGSVNFTAPAYADSASSILPYAEIVLL